MAEGLGSLPQKEWPSVSSAQAAKPPIELLKPGSDTHARVLTYLRDRIRMSERRMAQFYPRWRFNEQRVQAYIDLPDYEKILKAMNDSGKAPAVTSIVVPYAHSVVSTIVTYQLHTFCSRKPILQVGANAAEYIESAEQMEVFLQYNADHSRLVKHIFNFLNDTSNYGVGILRTSWSNERAMRTTRRSQTGDGGVMGAILGAFAPGKRTSTERKERLVYSGNVIESIDPFMFFPDPRVPMSDVNKKGEFVFWRRYGGKFEALRNTRYRWVSAIPSQLPTTEFGSEGGDSARALRAGGQSTPGNTRFQLDNVSPYIQFDQGTCEIIPAELGIGDSKKVEKWLFTIGNLGQIIEARPFDCDHGMHPVAVAEPLTFGYGFGNLGTADYLGPLQDTISWFINSHIHNVRGALNNSFIVDPSLVEMQDIRSDAPNKIIRLKKTAFGQDVRAAVTQLAVADVTSNHPKDVQLMMGLGERLTAATDNLQGIQDDGSRKTATEVRVSGESAASRLAAQCRIISSQAIVDLAEQMSLNAQQFLDEEFALAVLGIDGVQKFYNVGPESLVGDFNYPTNDGTLPIDKTNLLGVWTQILEGVGKDQQLRQEYDLGKIFEFVAELGGARNISSFKITSKPDAEVAAGAQAGNLVPTSALGQAQRAQPSPMQ